MEAMDGKLVEDRAELGGGYGMCLNEAHPSKNAVLDFGVEGFLPKVVVVDLEPVWLKGEGFCQ